MTKFIASMLDVADQYDVFIVDMFGVVHDGKTLFPGVKECLAQLQKMHKKVILLSNAPYRMDFMKSHRLRNLGVTDNLYNHAHSSGEETHLQLPDLMKEYGNRIFPICRFDRDEAVYHGTDAQIVDDIGRADLILNTDGCSDEHPLGEYDHWFKQTISQGVRMICANPDKQVLVGGKKHDCAGMMAGVYEEMGGQVIYFGKPHSHVYDRCRNFFEAGQKVLVVGDALHTDIAGANAQGWGGLLVKTGLHGHVADADWEQEFVAHGQRPTYVAPGFRFPSDRTTVRGLSGATFQRA